MSFNLLEPGSPGSPLFPEFFQTENVDTEMSTGMFSFEYVEDTSVNTSIDVRIHSISYSITGLDSSEAVEPSNKRKKIQDGPSPKSGEKIAKCIHLFQEKIRSLQTEEKLIIDLHKHNQLQPPEHSEVTFNKLEKLIKSLKVIQSEEETGIFQLISDRPQPVIDGMKLSLLKEITQTIDLVTIQNKINMAALASQMSQIIQSED